MKKILTLLLVSYTGVAPGQTLSGKNTQARIDNGLLQGTTAVSGVHIFKGIPYAQPPVGNLRWKAPQPLQNWKGVKMADHFGPRPMQEQIYGDMFFRSKTDSEDCLYLNVWTPANSTREKLPVLVYFYGGGLRAGAGDENRYDGESMAQKGIVVVTLNYRLGIFGFLSLPALTKESPHHASGNYGLLDQHAAMEWVHRNIAAFGGDPDKVTIAGESAGAMSVCAQMATPLSKGLFRGAIAESGSMLGNLSPQPLAAGEKAGEQFMKKAGVHSLAELRAMPADSLLRLSHNTGFPTVVDGYFLPESPQAIFTTGRQMDVPLLAGWNSAEVDNGNIFGKKEATLENYRQAVKALYPRRTEEILRAYPAKTDSDAAAAATQLASDRFIAYATWKFIDLHGKTNGYPVYRYLFARRRPLPLSGTDYRNPYGAVHASEIDYALGNLHLNKVYGWTPEDKKVSQTMQQYFANFIKNGTPNGEGLPHWFGLQSSIPKIMRIDVDTHSEPEQNLRRYVLLDSIYTP